jgi:hypothetical protein
VTTSAPYKIEVLESGLLVRDVVIAVTGDTGRGYDLTPEHFEKFVSSFEARVTRGHVGAFVRLGHSGPRIGRIQALRAGSGELRGDLLFESAFDKAGEVRSLIEAGAITDLSITFARDAGVLIDVSLLDATFGQLHDRLPPFVLDTKSEFGVGEVEALALRTEEHMRPEEFQKMLEDQLAPLSARLGKLETAPTPLARTLTGDAEVDAAADAKLAKRLEELQIAEEGRQLDHLLVKLEAVNGGANARQRKQWRERLEEVPASARQYRFEAMALELERSRSRVTLDAEAPFVRQGVEKALAEEFENFSWPEGCKVSKADYVATHKSAATDLR